MIEANESQVQGLAIGAKTGLIGSIGGRFLSVISNVLIARLLGPAVFGIYAIGWTIFRFFSLVVPLGMDRAVLRFAPKYWNTNPANLKGLLVNVDKIAFGSGLLTGILFFFLSPWLANSIYQQPELTAVFHLFAFAFPLISLLIVASAATRITKQIRYSVTIYDLGQPLLGLALYYCVLFSTRYGSKRDNPCGSIVPWLCCDYCDILITKDFPRDQGNYPRLGNKSQ